MKPGVGVHHARRRSARVNEDLLPAGDLLGVTYSGLFLGSCAFYSKEDGVVVQSPLTNPLFVEIVCAETGALKTKARLAEEKARKIEKALVGVASAADTKHAVENTEKKIEQAVLLRERHEMKVEVAESERKRSAEVAEELRQQLQKQVEEQLKLTGRSPPRNGAGGWSASNTLLCNALLPEEDTTTTS
ncbi:hypothetical protein CYMTET_40372 [Cymbomonas tetramitiformis]|uniref:Uncharacterized protein n=1 Tax=Cymbomonas tetramitiformis TaxID=36881 RepID=A0AAE0C878_9CHLO|nr:hypothetical protein CYMTET_40372 [Cymbomonas tetramitiformis]